MNLSGVISIAGMSGLYKVVAQSKNGLIVESLVDKKRLPAYSSQKVSALEDISIFTTEDSAPLKDIFQKIFDKHKGEAAIDHKSADDTIKKYFSELLPNYDKDKVYMSDMRKVISWYNLLQKTDLLTAKAEETKEETEAKPKTTEEGVAKPKKATKSTKEKTAKSVKNTAAKRTQGVRKTGTA